MVTQLTWQTWMAATAKYFFRIKKILLVNTFFSFFFFLIVLYYGHYLEILFKYTVVFFIYYITVIRIGIKTCKTLMYFCVS